MRLLFLVLFLFQLSVGMAQVSMTLHAADRELQKNNLILLAEQYNISAAQAAVIQAKIWEQPYIYSEWNAINPEDGKVFDIGNRGQKQFSVEQLIYLGGKKRNEVEYARSNETLARLEFEQLLRTLKYNLALNFYSLYYDLQKEITLQNQISQLDTLLANYEVQARRGNIPLKELVRLQSLILTLKNERNTVVRNIMDEQQSLLLLTGTTEMFTPDVDEKLLISKYNSTGISKDSLITAAVTNNPEYLTALRIIESRDLYLRWQKSLAVPDLAAGMAYDQRGGAFQNQINVTLGIPLPLWNRNRGNIKIAEAEVKQASLQANYKKAELQSRVELLWQLWQQQQQQLESISTAVTDNLELVYTGMLSNFQKRNVSLVEFVDFMESYNETKLQINEIKKSWIQAGISLNYLTNQEVF